jgi:hypothetical protein
MAYLKCLESWVSIDSENAFIRHILHSIQERLAAISRILDAFAHEKKNKRSNILSGRYRTSVAVFIVKLTNVAIDFIPRGAIVFAFLEIGKSRSNFN